MKIVCSVENVVVRFLFKALKILSMLTFLHLIFVAFLCLRTLRWLSRD